MSRAFLRLHRLAHRARAKAFSLMARGSFASFGSSSVIEPPVRLSGEARMAVGDGVFVAAGSWLQVIDGQEEGVALQIGSGTSFAGPCVLSAVAHVRVGERVLFARNVYVADHAHAYAEAGVPVMDQGLDSVAPVEIGDGAWLGQNVIVCPGVTIGRGAVVGANSVVRHDVPDFSLAVGTPARVVRRFGPQHEARRLAVAQASAS